MSNEDHPRYFCSLVSCCIDSSDLQCKPGISALSLSESRRCLCSVYDDAEVQQASSPNEALAAEVTVAAAVAEAQQQQQKFSLDRSSRTISTIGCTVYNLHPWLSL